MITECTRSRQPIREAWTDERLFLIRSIALGLAIEPSTSSAYDSHLNSYINFCQLHHRVIDPTHRQNTFFLTTKKWLATAWSLLYRAVQSPQQQSDLLMHQIHYLTLWCGFHTTSNHVPSTLTYLESATNWNSCSPTSAKCVAHC